MIKNTAMKKSVVFIMFLLSGTLVFYVGRYLTDTIQLRSNVYIKLSQGPVLTVSPSPFDYRTFVYKKALIVADGQAYIGISGERIVEGSGEQYPKNISDLLDAGYIKQRSSLALIAFSNCTNISVGSLNL